MTTSSSSSSEGAPTGSPKGPPPDTCTDLKHTIFASAFAISLGKMATHPLDTAKAKLQIRRSGAAASSTGNGTTTTLRGVLRSSTLRELYSGFPIAVTGALPAGALYMTTYEYCKERFREDSRGYGMNQNHFLTDFTAGFIAEVVSCVFWCPVDVIKERLQVQKDLRNLYYSSSNVAETGGPSKQAYHKIEENPFNKF